MKLTCLYLILLLPVILLLVAQDRALAWSNNPPDGYTGAPDENTCAKSGCHGSPGVGSISLSGVPSAYVTSSEYTITVNLSHSGQSRWGFELTVLDDASNNAAGTLTVTDSINTQKGTGGGREYIKHTNSGTYAGTLNSASWSLKWTAPSTYIGAVSFYVAGNAADGNGQKSGDFIYTNTDQSLAVELSSFTAQFEAGVAKLSWRTETEVNNIGFAIYRSKVKDGNYTPIAFVDGAGNSLLPRDYQFIDEEVQLGQTYFYYLQDVDITGDRSKSEIIELVVIPNQKLKVAVPFTRPVLPMANVFRLLQNYPNPFNPETWMPFKLAQDTSVAISIYDTKGQLIRTLSLGNRNAGIYTSKDRAAYWDGKDSFDQKVSSGVYYYTLKAGEFRATRKMVIVK